MIPADAVRPAERPVWARGTLGFTLASAALIMASGFGLTLFFRGPGDSQAILFAGIFAAAVQIGAFPLLRRLTATNLMIGMGTGSLIRMFAFGAFVALAWVVFHLPMPAALVSLALFYFLTMVVEPLFLQS